MKNKKNNANSNSKEVIDKITFNRAVLLFSASVERKESTPLNGPSYAEQSAAIVSGQNWTVLNSHLLNNAYIINNGILKGSVNVIKQLLQTYGSNGVRDKIPNTNCHPMAYHVHLEFGLTYILEWVVLSEEKRILAITDFGPHENFRFLQGLTKAQIQAIYANPKNQEVFDREQVVLGNLKEKAVSLHKNYKNVM